MKLSAKEREFLERLRDGKPLALADRVEDRARQKMRRSGFAEVLSKPRRWAITDKGRAAIQAVEEME